jgi:hypothetical protein
VSRSLTLLTPRQERVIRMRYGISGPDYDTYEDVSKAFNVTRERVRQIEASAIRGLKHPQRKQHLIEAAQTMEVGGRFDFPRPIRVLSAEQDRAYIRPAPKREAYGPPRPEPEPEARPLRRRVEFPEYRPFWHRLLEIPPYERNDEQKLHLAYALDLELQRRGAGALRIHPDSVGHFAKMSERQVQLAKYDWFMAHLDELGRAFPPKFVP